MRPLVVVALVAVALVAAVSGIALPPASPVIEPRMVHVDRSPPIGGGRPNRNAPNRPQGKRGGAPPGRKIETSTPSKVVGGGMTDESVTFGVNTRGELGAKHASLMCKCDVLSILVDEEDNERRSYTAPELRARVPQVSIDYAKKNKQVSFGVNVRGEEGNEFNPTWCNCQVQGGAKDQKSGGAPMRGGPAGRGDPKVASDENDDEDDDEEAEDQSPASLRRGAGSPHGMPSKAGGPMRPGRTAVHLQLDEGMTSKPSITMAKSGHRLPTVEVVGAEAKPPTAAQLAEATINLQTEAGLDAAPAAPSRRRHSWSTGTDRPSLVGEQHLHQVHHLVHAPVKEEYMFHGHRYSGDGVDLSKPKTTGPTDDDIQAAAMMLAELAEGTGEDTDADPDAAAAAVGDANHTVIEESQVDRAALINEVVEDPTPSSSPSSTPSPSPSASPEPDEDSEADDAMAALEKLRQKHPHTSQVLSNALSAAASQQEVEVQQFQHTISEKDDIIRKLLDVQEKEHARFERELKRHEEYEAKLLETHSPSPSPSASAQPSESSTPSASPSPVPSPSPSASVSQEFAAEHYVPRVNRKACYNTCRDRDCKGLFDESLQHYTDCMEACAAECYA